MLLNFFALSYIDIYFEDEGVYKKTVRAKIYRYVACFVLIGVNTNGILMLSLVNTVCANIGIIRITFVMQLI